MSDISEAVGTAVSGGLVARAIEPDHGEAKDGHTHESACLNCGAALIGNYCHSCGQHAHLHKTIGAFFHDLLHGALHFEGKTFHTLPLLAWKPGHLTRRYIDGKRASYVSPMALFLFSVFLLFATFQIAGISPPSNPVLSDGVVEGLDKAESEITKTRAQLEEELAALPADDPKRSELENRIDGMNTSIKVVSNGQSAGSEFDDLMHADTGWARLDKGLKKASTNPGLLLYKLMTNSYKFSWLLIPLSVPFLWLVFLWRPQFGIYDHAIFVTYSISFMTLMFIVLVGLVAVGLPIGAAQLTFCTVGIWHIGRQLRGAYGLSVFSATWRTIYMIFAVALVLMLFVGILILLGLLG